MNHLSHKAALLVVDVQEGFNSPKWGARNNRSAEATIARLIEAFRRSGRAVIHVHHDSTAENGHFKPGSPGNAHKPEARPSAGERIYHKNVNSAFIGTTLEQDLRAQGNDSLVVVGLTTNHCVSTTVRMAGNLGFDTYVVSDATATFARRALDGTMHSAEEVHLAALSDLADEFATVIQAADVLAALG